MVNADGSRVCDQEILNRKNKVWCGCRKPAVVTMMSTYTTSGLDYCIKHAPVCAAEAAIKLATGE